VKRWRETGSFEIKSIKGQSRSPLKKEEWLLELMRQEPDLTLEEIQRRLLDERQQKAGIGSVWRFFDRHGVSFKKSVRAAEQDRSGVAAARTAWAAAASSNGRRRLLRRHLFFVWICRRSFRRNASTLINHASRFLLFPDHALVLSPDRLTQCAFAMSGFGTFETCRLHWGKCPLSGATRKTSAHIEFFSV
jgi:hypothetical protein